MRRMDRQITDHGLPRTGTDTETASDTDADTAIG